MALTCIKTMAAVLLAAALAQAPARAQTGSDADLLAARDAAQRGQWKALEALRPRLTGHPLEAYPGYWLLAGTLDRADPAEIAAFLARYADSPLAESLRRPRPSTPPTTPSSAPFPARYPKPPRSEASSTRYTIPSTLPRPRPPANGPSPPPAPLAPGLGREATRRRWGQVAWQGAMAPHPKALEWYALAGATPLTDSQVAWRARAALRAGDWKAVLAAIDALSSAEAREPAWRYWKARALHQAGPSETADNLLRSLTAHPSFYGLLAAEEVGVPIAPEWNGWKPAQADLDRVAAHAGIQRALALYRLGLAPEALREWLWAIRGYGDRDLLAAAELARQANVPDRAINTADRTLQLHDLSQRFPTPHREALEAAARQWDSAQAML